MSKKYYYELSQCNNVLLETVFPENGTDPITIKDSGTSKHSMMINSPIYNLHCVDDGERIVLLNGDQIVSNHRDSVPIPTLSTQAREAHVFPVTQSALISISQLCDNGCDITFSKKMGSRVQR